MNAALLAGPWAFPMRVVLGATALWLLAAVAAMLCRRSAAVRHRLWSLATLVVLLLPLAVWWLPELRLGWIAPPAVAPGRVEPQRLVSHNVDTPPIESPHGLTASTADTAPSVSIDWRPLSTTGTGPSPVPSAAPPTRTSWQDLFSSPYFWALLLLTPGLWQLRGIVRSLWLIHGLVRRARAIDDPEAARQLALWRSELHWRGNVRLLESSETVVPLCTGLWRPTILLPEDWRQWSDDVLRAALGHELAHVVRRDVAWQLLARLACATYWFHPLAWLSAWRMRVERETACDDVVLAAGQQPVSYARVLMDLANRLSTAENTPNLALPMAASTGLEQRVRAILARGRARTPVGRAVGIVLLAAAVLATLGAGSLNPFARSMVSPPMALAAEQPMARAQTASDDAAATDLYGDPLPAGAKARFGTIRFRHSERGSIHILPDSTTVVTSPDEHSLRIWDARTGVLLREINLEPLHFDRFAVSPDGKLIAVPGFFNAEASTEVEVRVVDAESGKVVQSFKRDSRDNSQALAFMPDSKLLVSLGMGGLLRIEEVSSGTELLSQSFPRDNGATLAISPDGKRIAVQTGANTEKFFIWDWQTGQEPRALKTVGRPNGGGQITFSPDGQHVAWVGYSADPVHVWNADNGSLVARLKTRAADEYFVSGVEFDPNGKWLYTPARNNRDGRIHVWNAATWQYERTIDLPAYRIAISKDSRLLVTGNQVFDLKRNVESGSIENAHRESIAQIVTRPDLVVTASDDHSIRLWNAETGEQRLRLKHDAWVRAIALSPNGKHLVSSSLDDTVRLWELPSGKEIYRLPGHGRLGGTRAVAFMKDGERFCSFGDDWYLRVYDVRTGKALKEHAIRPAGAKVSENEDEEDNPFGNALHVAAVRFSADGKALAMGVGTEICIFDVFSGEQTTALAHDGGHITSIDFSPDGRHMLVCAWGKSIATKLADGRTRYSSAKNHTATLWQLEKSAIEATVFLPEGKIGPGVFSPDGGRFAVANDSQVMIYRLDGEAESMLPKTPGRIWRLAFASDSRGLYTAHRDASVLAWGAEAFVPAPAEAKQKK